MIIELEKLCAHEADHYACENCGIGTDWPRIYKLDVDGAEWWTDRHWLLPNSMLSRDVNEKWDIVKMPEQAADRARGWIKTLLMPGAIKGECTQIFAPTFAGVLSSVGLSARDTTDRLMCALVGPDGAPRGILMPLRPGAISEPATTIPVPAAVLRQRERIADAGVVHDGDQLWRLAVTLAGAK